MRIITLAKTTLPLGAALVPMLVLAACGSSEEPAADQTPATYSTDVNDLSGGEIIATEQDPDAVPVDLPETPMVPAEEAAADGEAPAE